MSDLNCYRLREVALKVEPHLGNSFSFSEGDLLCYYAGFNLSKFALHVSDHVEAVYCEAMDQLVRRDRVEAVEIIDMLKTVIETELVKLGLPTAATPTSALGRARSFIQVANAAPPRS